MAYDGFNQRCPGNRLCENSCCETKVLHVIVSEDSHCVTNPINFPNELQMPIQTHSIMGHLLCSTNNIKCNNY